MLLPSCLTNEHEITAVLVFKESFIHHRGSTALKSKETGPNHSETAIEHMIK